MLNKDRTDMTLDRQNRQDPDSTLVGNEDNFDDSCTNVTSCTVSEAPSDLDVHNAGADTDFLTVF